MHINQHIFIFVTMAKHLDSKLVSVLQSVSHFIFSAEAKGALRDGFLSEKLVC